MKKFSASPSACLQMRRVRNATMSGRPRFGSVRLRFGDGTVQAVLVFGSGGSSALRILPCFSTV